MGMPEYLTDQRVPFETLYHPPAFTAQRRAKVLHVSGRQVAKSVLLVRDREFVLAVLPAHRQIDLGALEQQLGGPMRLADDDEIADLFRDCEWGVVPPFGRLYGITTLLEDSLAPDTWIVFEGHQHMTAIRMRCRDYERVERPRRMRFAL